MSFKIKKLLIKTVIPGFFCALFFLHVLSANDLIWPLPPEKPRIKYIRTYTSSKNIEEERSFFGKIFGAISDFIFGSESKGIRLFRPHSIYVDNDDKIYVTDTGLKSVVVFDLDEHETVKLNKTADGYLRSPVGVAVDDKGSIFVTDSVLKKIIVYSSDYKFLKEINGFKRPTGIAIKDKKLYIADTLANQIIVMDTKGKVISKFGRRGGKKSEFNFLTHIFVDSTGNIYVSDSMNFRIQVFDRDFKFKYSFGKLGDGMGDFARPKGVAVDTDNNIYIVDALFDTVQMFNTKGRVLLGFGSNGKGPGNFSLPSGIFIDPDDKIYVADSYNSRVQVFQYLKE